VFQIRGPETEKTLLVVVVAEVVAAVVVVTVVIVIVVVVMLQTWGPTTEKTLLPTVESLPDGWYQQATSAGRDDFVVKNK